MSKQNTKYNFYNGDKIFNLISSFKFIIGNRSAGKTFYFKRKCIEDFIKKNKKFILMRRYKTEIDIIKNNFFRDIEKYFNYKYSIEVKGDDVLIDGKHAGRFIPLTSISKYKSINMSDYDKIIYDEFIPEDNKYLNQNKNYYFEVESCLNIYQTVARGLNESFREEVKFIFISNSVSTSNPYFSYFGIDKLIWNGTKKYYKDKFFSFEIINVENEIEKTPFGQFIENTSYGRYALKNDFYKDKNYNICDKIPKGAKTLFSIEFNDKYYTVFKNQMFLYVKDVNVEKTQHFSLTNDGKYKYFANTIYHKLLKSMVSENKVFFSNVSIKNILTNY